MRFLAKGLSINGREFDTGSDFLNLIIGYLFLIIILPFLFIAVGLNDIYRLIKWVFKI
jgi:hypothetical protein